MVEDDFQAYGNEDFPVLQLLASDTAVDLAAVKDEAKADMRAAADARKAEADAKAGKGKPAKAKAKKTTTADAKAGIAEAMRAQTGERPDDSAPGTQIDGQGLEPVAEIGKSVRIKEGLNGPNGKLRKICGRKGVLVSYMGDVWTVRVDATDGAGSQTTRARRDEFIVLPDPAAGGGDPVETIEWPFPTAAASTADKKPKAKLSATAAWPFQ
jgi:hypothetical protein